MLVGPMRESPGVVDPEMAPIDCEVDRSLQCRMDGSIAHVRINFEDHVLGQANGFQHNPTWRKRF